MRLASRSAALTAFLSSTLTDFADFAGAASSLKKRAISARERKRLPVGEKKYVSKVPAVPPPLRTSVRVYHPPTMSRVPPQVSMYSARPAMSCWSRSDELASLAEPRIRAFLPPLPPVVSALAGSTSDDLPAGAGVEPPAPKLCLCRLREGRACCGGPAAASSPAEVTFTNSCSKSRSPARAAMLQGCSGDQLYLTALVKTLRTSVANAMWSSW
eukprot:scaffold283800_cov30-Tisochrysis_lutea.AAC.1